MKEPRWVDRRALLLLHAESLAEHGGLAGTREEGLTRNHPFVDGNKRASFLAAGLFLELNGSRLVADKANATQVMLALSAGELGEEEFAAWLRARIKRRK